MPSSLLIFTGSSGYNNKKIETKTIIYKELRIKIKT